VLIPLAWKWQVRRHPELFDAPRVTHTPNGIPGDPVNVAFLGSEADVIHAMVAAKWDPADPLTFRSTVRIALDSVFRQPELQGKNGAAIRGARMDGLKSPRFISTKAILKSGNEICFAA
jgi:hypothetical protein